MSVLNEGHVRTYDDMKFYNLTGLQDFCSGEQVVDASVTRPFLSLNFSKRKVLLARLNTEWLLI